MVPFVLVCCCRSSCDVASYIITLPPRRTRRLVIRFRSLDDHDPPLPFFSIATVRVGRQDTRGSLPCCLFNRKSNWTVTVSVNCAFVICGVAIQHPATDGQEQGIPRSPESSLKLTAQRPNRHAIFVFWHIRGRRWDRYPSDPGARG